jgi:D-alanine-D-alanine ligase
MKVLVLLGGDSPEREVSLRSGRAVADALKAGGHEVLEYDPKNGFDTLSQFVGKIDCVFPILHGKGGEDGTIQEDLEKLGFKYLGSDSKVSKICFDKIEFKKILESLNILTPKGEAVTKESISNSELIRKPYVLKPIDGGSTIDTFIIRDPVNQSYDPAVFDRHNSMLMEELIEGTEITVPVLGDSPLPVIEIIPPEGQEFDYENKYNGATQELCPPPHVDNNKQREAQGLAEHIHKAVGARHISRTDFIIDKDGKLWALELNTMPGLNNQSLTPVAAKAVGMDMQQLVEKFLQMVMAYKIN